MEKWHINPSGLYHIPAYTQIVGVKGGTTYYLAGMVAFDEDLNLVAEGDLEAQLVQVFENIETALLAVDAHFEDVVKLTVYVVDYQPSYRELVLGVVEKYVNRAYPPAMTLLGVQALARPGLLVEVEATAVVD